MVVATNQPIWGLSSFFMLFLLPVVSQAFNIYVDPTPIPYSDHCASIVPESIPNVRDKSIWPIFQTSTSYFTGGKRIFGKNELSFDSEKYVSIHPTESIFKTNTSGVYKVMAHLSFLSSDGTFICLPADNDYGYIPRKSLIFVLHGFWSRDSGKLCMVGSGSCYSKEGNLVFDAVLKLSCPVNSDISTRLITGKLESLSYPNDSKSYYFEPISIVALTPSSNNYNYTLVSDEETDRGCCSGGMDTNPHSQSLGLRPGSFCAMLQSRKDPLELEYTNDQCFTSSPNCTFLGQVITRNMLLRVIHCSEHEQKVHFLVGSGNHSHVMEDHRPFDPTTTLVAEGSWDGNKNRLCVVACRILDSTGGGNAHVGDCSIRMSLRYPAFSSIRNKNIIFGEIWTTNKTVYESGCFNKVTFGSNDNEVVGVPGLRHDLHEHTRNDWDVVIPCGGMLFAVLIYFLGGRCFLLRKFWVTEAYEKFR